MTSLRRSALLERSAQLALFDDRLAAVRRDRRGRLVLVSGEAGIGKTALLRAFCDRPQALRVLWGGCDALHTPRALGPFVDIAEQSGGELAAVVGRAATPRGGRRGARRRAARPADDPRARGSALGRRGHARRPAAARTPHRSAARAGARDLPRRRARPHAPAAHGARRAAGRRGRAGRAGAAQPRRGRRAGGRDGVDAAALHRSTAGNPFFVSEVLATHGGEVPDTVRDAVLARAARLDPDARTVLDAVAIEPDAGRALAARGARRGRGRRASTRASPRACCAASAARSASATRSRGSWSRRRSRRIAGRCSRAGRSARSPPRSAGGRTWRGSPITPRRPTTPRPCCATPSPRASGRRRSDRIARRPRSSPRALRYASDCSRERRAELLGTLFLRVLSHRPHRRCDRGAARRDGRVSARRRPPARG